MRTSAKVLIVKILQALPFWSEWNLLAKLEIVRWMCKRNIDRVILVFDNKTANPVYAGVMVTIMLARAFAVLGYKVDFLLIQGEYSIKWPQYLRSETRIKAFEIEQIGLLEQFLSRHDVQTKVMTWHEFLEYKKTFSRKDYVAFALPVMNRMHKMAIHQFAHNFFKFLTRNLSTQQVDRILLSTEDFSDTHSVPRELSNYVAYNVRVNKDWGSGRDVSVDTFLAAISYLKLHFPDRQILIVSTIEGIEFCKEIAHEQRLELFYSKDYNSSFIGDCFLVLAASQYFSYLAGGMSSVAMLSKIPYIVYARHSTAKSHQKNGRMFAFSAHNQTVLDPEEFEKQMASGFAKA